MDDLRGRAAEEPVLQTGPPVHRHRDQVDICLIGGIENGLRGRRVYDSRLDRRFDSEGQAFANGVEIGPGAEVVVVTDSPSPSFPFGDGGDQDEAGAGGSGDGRHEGQHALRGR